MPAGDSRSAELGRMKNKMVETEAALKEERKAIARLQDQNEKRYQQIVDVESDIAAEQERFRWAKEELLFQIHTVKSESTLRIDTMKEEEKQLLQEISEFAVLQHQNEQLHLKLKLLSLEHKQLNQQQTEERELKKQKDFDVRMAMDEIFRKTLKSVDENYHKQAIAKMKFEASQANSENDEIHREFDLREKQTEALIRQQQQSFDQLMKIRIEKDVLNMSISIQEKNIRKFRRQNKENEIEIRELLAKVRQWEDELEALSSMTASKSTLVEQCNAIQNEITTVKEETEKTKQKTLKLCQKLVSKALRIADTAARNGTRLKDDELNLLTNVNTNDSLHDAQNLEFDALSEAQKASQHESPHEQWDPESVWRSNTSRTNRNGKNVAIFHSQSFSLL